MSDLDIVKGRPFEEMHHYYMTNFSLGHLSTDINSKFALISLVCYITNKAKEKKPDVTYYQILMQITKNNSMPETFIKGLAIMCEDFGYGCKEFPTFNIKPSDMVATVQRILQSYTPF